VIEASQFAIGRSARHVFVRFDIDLGALVIPIGSSVDMIQLLNGEFIVTKMERGFTFHQIRVNDFSIAKFAFYRLCLPQLFDENDDSFQGLTVFGVINNQKLLRSVLLIVLPIVFSKLVCLVQKRGVPTTESLGCVQSLSIHS